MSEIFDLNTQRAALAEFVGTFFLALAALVSGTPYAVALTLTAFVYAIGNISGCNINPGVTLGLMVARRLSIARGLYYLVAQFDAALVARIVAGLSGKLAPHYSAGTAPAEFFGFAFLILTVVAVDKGYVPQSGSGVAIGAALAAGLLTSKGVINPAIAIGMGLTLTPASWAPLLSAIVFALVFQLYGAKDKAPQQDEAQEETQPVQA